MSSAATEGDWRRYLKISHNAHAVSSIAINCSMRPSPSVSATYQKASAGEFPKGQPTKKGKISVAKIAAKVGNVGQTRALFFQAFSHNPIKISVVIACAMAHRANRIAFALVRDQTPYDPSRWTQED